jgi:hypothetical protein
MITGAPVRSGERLAQVAPTGPATVEEIFGRSAGSKPSPEGPGEDTRTPPICMDYDGMLELELPVAGNTK